jgi:hypothetical protein
MWREITYIRIIVGWKVKDSHSEGAPIFSQDLLRLE